MSNVARHNDGATHAQARAYGIFSEFFEHFFHRLVEVDFHTAAFACVAEFLRNPTRRIIVEFLNPNTVLVDLTLDVSVGRATHADAYRQTCAVAGQTNYTNIVGKIFTAKLSTKSYLIGLFEQLFLQFEVAESTAGLVARSGEVIVVVSRSQFHGHQVFLRTRTTDGDTDMVRRAGSRTEALHLFNEERNERRLVENGFRFLEEVGFIGRTATLHHAEEFILVAFLSFDVDLCGQVAARVHLLKHRERRIL